LAVALGVVLGPAPEVLASLLESALSLPAKLGVGAGWVSGEVKNVTSTAGSNLVGQITANGGGEGTDHLVDSAALAGTQVPGTDTGVVGAEVVESLQVTISEVKDVDVVTDGSAVVGGIV
jgi:hypothetical protein